ncbi:Exportin-6 [Phlyctochytrium bullatum]|nr:Exportin-6 [Phlyctochytrium bullatum]
MLQDEASLAEIVNEYFSESSSQVRKRELEQTLSSVRSHPQSLGVCHNLLQKDGQSPFVEWFCFSAFEQAVRHWHKLSVQERIAYRHFLWGLLTTRHAAYKPFVLNTLIKTLVTVGAMDYPREWPTFFQDMLDLRSSSLTVALTVIRTCLEEFASDRLDVPSFRKSELRMALVQQAPSLIPFVTQILTAVYQTALASPDSIPFSSPTEKGAASIGLGLHSPLKPDLAWLLPNVGESPSKPMMPAAGGGQASLKYPGAGGAGGAGSGPRVAGQGRSDRGGTGPGAGAGAGTRTGGNALDPTAFAVCSLSLNILLQLFSTIPLTEDAVPAVDVVLKFCELYEPDTVELGTLAMSVVNELISRNFVPEGALAFILSIARETCVLLRRFTDEGGVLAAGEFDLDENYQSKFTDFLNGFVSCHVHRGENIPDFPMSEFLQLFYRYTFLQPNQEGFLQCLHVWDTFLEYMIAQRSLSATQGDILASRYNGGLVSLAKDTLSKIFMTENSKDLSDIDYEKYEAEGLSEWERFTQPCLDLIVKITEFYPSDLLSAYFNILVGFSDRLVAMDPNLAKKMERRSVIQDISTMARLFGQLSAQFTINFSLSAGAAFTLLKKIMEVLRFSLQVPGGSIFDAILCLYLFGALKLYIHWMQLYYNSCLAKPDELDQCREFIHEVIDLCMLSLGKSKESALAGSRLLLSLAETVRPDLLSYPSISPLLVRLKEELPSDLPDEACRSLYMAVANACLFPQNESSTGVGRAGEQEWKARHANFVSLCEGHVGTFKTVVAMIESNPRAAADPATKQQVRRLLLVFIAMFDTVEGGNVNSKEVVASGLSEVLKIYSPLLLLLQFDPELFESFLDFALSAMKSLKRQIARDHFHVVTDTLSTFFKIMQSNSFVALLGSGSGSVTSSTDSLSGGKGARGGGGLLSAGSEGGGATILDKFVIFLSGIVEEGSKTFEALLPDVIGVITSDLFARLLNFESSRVESVKSHYYDMLFKAIVSHQQYFFGSVVKSMAGRQANEASHDGELLSLLKALAGACMDANMEVFRQTLVLFEGLHAKCLLFGRKVVQEHFLVPFGDMLLGILVRRSHNFMKDDIIATLCRVFLCGNDAVKAEIIPTFLKNHCYMLSQEQQQVLAGYLADIKKATSENNVVGHEDMVTNLEIADKIRAKEGPPKQAVQSLKRRINHKNPNVQLQALKLTDTCVKNSGHHFVVEIASRDFIDNLVSITRNYPQTNQDVRLKILALIQTWGLAFKGKSELGYVTEVYEMLKREGIAFPPVEKAEASSIMIDTKTDVRVCDSCHYKLTNKTPSAPGTPSAKRASTDNGKRVSFSTGTKPSGGSEKEDEDLQKAIEASLAEAEKNKKYNAKPKTVVVAPPPKDEEEDPDLKAAIEASLAELRLSEERQKKQAAAASSGYAQSPTSRGEPIPQINPNQLSRVEIDNLKMFVELVERMDADVATRGIGVIHNSQISAFEHNEKITAGLQMYDRLLQERLNAASGGYTASLSRSYSVPGAYGAPTSQPYGSVPPADQPQAWAPSSYPQDPYGGAGYPQPVPSQAPSAIPAPYPPTATGPEAHPQPNAYSTPYHAPAGYAPGTASPPNPGAPADYASAPGAYAAQQPQPGQPYPSAGMAAAPPQVAPTPGDPAGAAPSALPPSQSPPQAHQQYVYTQPPTHTYYDQNQQAPPQSVPPAGYPATAPGAPAMPSAAAFGGYVAVSGPPPTGQYAPGPAAAPQASYPAAQPPQEKPTEALLIEF